MEVIKEFVVKVTSVQTFTLIQMTLSSKPDTYSGATIWNSSKWSIVVNIYNMK